MTIGERIQELREASGLSRFEVAHRAKIREYDMYRFEENKNVPRATTLASLAQALGTSTDYLITGQEPASVR